VRPRTAILLLCSGVTWIPAVTGHVIGRQNPSGYTNSRSGTMLQRYGLFRFACTKKDAICSTYKVNDRHEAALKTRPKVRPCGSAAPTSSTLKTQRRIVPSKPSVVVVVVVVITEHADPRQEDPRPSAPQRRSSEEAIDSFEAELPHEEGL
jgi:hypothetical protein